MSQSVHDRTIAGVASNTDTRANGMITSFQIGHRDTLNKCWVIPTMELAKDGRHLAFSPGKDATGQVRLATPGGLVYVGEVIVSLALLEGIGATALRINDQNGDAKAVDAYGATVGYGFFDKFSSAVRRPVRREGCRLRQDKGQGGVPGSASRPRRRRAGRRRWASRSGTRPATSPGAATTWPFAPAGSMWCTPAPARCRRARTRMGVIYTGASLAAEGIDQLEYFHDGSWGLVRDAAWAGPRYLSGGYWRANTIGPAYLTDRKARLPFAAEATPAPPPATPQAPVVPESDKWHKTTITDLAEQLEGDTYTNDKGGKQTKLKARMDLLPAEALLSVGLVLERGSKYGEENWHATTIAENLNHAQLHLQRFRAGDRGEAHLSHAACRVLFALWLEIRDRKKLEV
jgi:hypothetical protein